MVLTGVEKQLMEILLKLKLMMFRDTKNKTTSPKRLAINCKRNNGLENSLLRCVNAAFVRFFFVFTVETNQRFLIVICSFVKCDLLALSSLPLPSL